MTLHDILQLVAPGVIVLGGLRWLVSWFWKRFEAKFDESHAELVLHRAEIKSELQTYRTELKGELQTSRGETNQRLDRIEQQTMLTNGRVNALEKQDAKLEGILIGRNQTGGDTPP